MINTNLNGHYYFIKETLPYMEKGCIINISSRSALNGDTTCVPYTVAKAGLNALTETYSKITNNRVNSISPSWVNTNMLKRFPNEIHDKVFNPKAIAKIAVDLASGYGNGKNIII